MKYLWLAVLFLGISAVSLSEVSVAQQRPNILWIVQEDMSPWLGCYGDKINQVHTPNMDQLAAGGVRFDRAYVSAPVCSSCRSGLIVGAPAFRFGAHHHRSRRGKAALPLAKGMKTLPEFFQEAGYQTFNIGKTDYNFSSSKPLYEKHRNYRQAFTKLKGKAFFGQIQLKGGKSKTKGFQPKTDPTKVTVPADYPQNELFRGIVAQHYDTIRKTDKEVGEILKELEKAGLAENTVVIMFSDHGANNLVRHKQMPTEAGLHVPLIISGPKNLIPAGGVRKDLVSLLDVSATTLKIAGIPSPKWIEGQDLFSKDFQKRTFVGGHRDRCDHTIDRVRTIRTDRFRYTKNYLLDRVLLQPQYRDPRPFTKFLRKAYAEGKLSNKLREIYFGERPSEELYDIQNDPAQVHNLANDPMFQTVLNDHRAMLKKWLAKGDLAEKTEPNIELVQNGNGRRHQGVNPEFESVRKDSDGDGLSDKWEKINGRDPLDGRLKFEFDCGGWQTEGWATESAGINIAGFQGFLDFELVNKKLELKRNGLRLKKEKNLGKFVVRLKSSMPVSVSLSVNGKLIGESRSEKGDWREVTFSVDKNWPNDIQDLELAFSGERNQKIELDWIRIVD